MQPIVTPIAPVDLVSERAASIREQTGVNWEAACQRAETERSISLLVEEGEEDTARTRYGDVAVDVWFREVEAIDPDAARIDFDELQRRLDDIGADICALALSIGLPDPGAAKAEDLLREMWAKVHAHDADQGVHIDEGRALGWHA